MKFVYASLPYLSVQQVGDPAELASFSYAKIGILMEKTTTDVGNFFNYNDDLIGRFDKTDLALIMSKS